MSLRAALGGWSSPALSAALIGVALLTFAIALEVHSPVIKAGILAYEILP